MSLHLLSAIGAGFLGACIGSFLTVVTTRIPLNNSIVAPGSACPRCSADVKWFDNIPIISWFVLQGKCRSCKLPIPFRYMALEAITCVMFVACAVALLPLLVLPVAAVFTGLIAIAEMYRTQRRIYWKVIFWATICALILGVGGSILLSIG
jgi:leader peptidase (prepilin peptidase) / N-methyltransferase